ncbi:CHAT domain-containing protein [Fulvivirgaceae bacterium PWU37]|uniref:CHAT domain-containing protein n=2 Tax=Dawidia soli TaxID=2782352 RepID=A0AAP2D8Y4_9BACT|nr:CHAT domain-containing protein [Dawidia soli]
MLCCLSSVTAVASQQEPIQHLLSRANQVYQRGVYDSALFLYQTVAQRCLFANAPQLHIAACTGIGNVFMKRRDYDHATLYLDSARSMAAGAEDRSAEAGEAFYACGVLYDLINQPDRALQFHREALAIRRKLWGDQHAQVAESYNGLGEVYRYTLRDYASAEHKFQQAVEILTSLSSPDLKQLYRSYYNLATTNRLKNDFEKASGYAYKAIDALERMRPTDTPALMRCYGMLANIYNNQGAFEKSIVYYRKAIGLRRTSGMLYTSEMANDYKNLSIAYTETKRVALSLACADSARHILLARNAHDSAELANVSIIRGKALQAAGRNPLALKHYHDALAILERYADANPLDITNVCRHISDVLEADGKYKEGLLYLQRGICVAAGEGIHAQDDMRNPSFDKLKNIPQCYQELSQKGDMLMKLAEEQGQPYTYWRLALECFKLSDRLMDLHWQAQDRESSRLRFVSINYAIYEAALACAHHLYGRTGDVRYISEAFSLIDKSKGRILRARLEEVGRQLQRQIPDSIMQQERTIRHAIASLQQQLSKLQAPADSLERVINTALVAEEEKLRLWQERTGARFPGAVVVDQPVSPMELAMLKSKLGDNAVFVEYFTGKTHIYAVAIYAGKEHLLRFPVGTTEEDVRTLGELLAAGVREKLLRDDYAVYTRLATRLGETLLAPVFRACDLKTDQALPPVFIVPDGILNLLPFQALLLTAPDRDGVVDYRQLDYVVRHASVAYSYDAASLFAHPAERTRRRNLLAYGWSDGTEQVAGAGSLPGARQELEAIAGIMRGTFVAGRAAGKRSFLEQAPDYAVLHLALHGKADAQDIYNCYLQFQDGKLFAHELYSLRLKADLTVLSACETGYGKSFRAEGVYSVARGFFHAGARNVVMSLWRIDDGTTASLMQKFYAGLGQETIGTALAVAQREYLQEADQYTAHPSYWAGMVSWGNTHKITPGEEDPFLYGVVSGMIFLVLTGTLLLTWKKVRSKVSIPGLPAPAMKYLKENV